VSGDSNTITEVNDVITNLYGSGNTVYLNQGAYLGIGSGNNDVVYNDVAGNTVNLDANTSATISGTGGYIGILGTGVTVTASGESISAVPGAYFTVMGSSDTIVDGANGLAAVYGSNNTISLSQGASLGIGSGGTGDIVYNDVAGNFVDLDSNTSTTVTGNGGYLGIYGTGVAVTASGESVGVTTGASFTITGNSNTLILATGDSVTLAGISDTANVSGNTGAIVIDNGAAGAQTASNTLAFGSGVSDEQLWFVQSGNNLQIDFMNTQAEVTIANWFSGAGNQFSEVTAGGLEIDAQISQLVQAMATYSGNNPGFNPTAVSQAPSDANLQAAIAAAWHH
jgi:hypothetical protein